VKTRLLLCLSLLLVPEYLAAQTYPGWSVVETEHFRFEFPPAPVTSPAVFAAAEERAYARLHEIFPASLPAKIHFFVWNSNEQAQPVLGATLGFSNPSELLIHATYDQTPGHELTHVLVYHAVRPEVARRFFQEGTAIAFDLTDRDRIALARAAVTRAGGRYGSVTEIIAADAAAGDDILYPVAGAFVERLAARGGHDRLLQFLKNQSSANARAVYGADFERIMREFDADVFPASAAHTQQPAPLTNPALEGLRAQAQARMRQDTRTFSREDVQKIEALYQQGNRDIRDPKAREVFLQLVSAYPKSNRTGCAVLYLAQTATGEERERYLKLAIDSHGDAWYGDGAQVGPLARAMLAQQYAATGRADEARAVALEIERSTPDAVDHTGAPLVDSLRRMRILPTP